MTCLQFDDDKIISGSDDNIINIYDTATGKLRKRLIGHTGGVWVLHYYGNTLVSGSTDRTVRIWDIEEGKCTHQFEGHTSTVRCLQILIPTKNPITGKIEPEFPLIVTGSRDTTLRVWRLPDTKKDKPYFPQSQQQTPAAANPQAINENDQLSTIPIIPLAQQQPAGQGQANGSQADGNNNIANVIAGRMNVINTTNTSTSSGTNNNVNPYFLHTLHGHTQSVRAVTGSGNVLVSGSYDSTVRVWDLKTGESVHLLRGHMDKVYSVGYSPELELAASGSMDTFVRVWSTKTGECLYQLEGHSSLVGLLEISPNYIVSAAADNTLRLWSPSTGRFITALYGHTAAITCFHHDTRLNRIVSGSEGTIKLWELCSDERLNKRHGTALATSEVGGVSTKTTYGTYKRDLVTGIQNVWKIEIDERRLVCAFQRGTGTNLKTWFEVLDYGEGLQSLEDEFVKNSLGQSSESSSYPKAGDIENDEDTKLLMLPQGSPSTSSSSSNSNTSHPTEMRDIEMKEKGKGEGKGEEEEEEGTRGEEEAVTSSHQSHSSFPVSNRSSELGNINDMIS